MKFTAVLALASVAAAAPKASAPVKVDLEAQGTSVTATVTNSGKKDIKVLKTGSILDQAPVEKAQVFNGDLPVEFDGIRLRLSDSIDEAEFETIAAGSSVSVTFDISELHDLSVGGKFKVKSAGALSVKDGESLSSVAFDSNTLEVDVDGEEAAASRIAFHAKRTQVTSSCSGSLLTITRNALSNCVRLARVGQQAAASGSAAKMTEFFKSSSSSTRSTVSQVFSRIASECGSTTGGSSTYYCSDVYGACSGGVLAYTLPSASVMAYCPSYFNQLPARSSACYGQDQGNTNLHEVTHLRQVKGTDDYGGYGYNFVRSLSGAQNLNHADTYTLFAQAVAQGC